jgi:hypothetical protein
MIVTLSVAIVLGVMAAMVLVQWTLVLVACWRRPVALATRAVGATRAVDARAGGRLCWCVMAAAELVIVARWSVVLAGGLTLASETKVVDACAGGFKRFRR